jgi:hypothetical protein
MSRYSRARFHSCKWMDRCSNLHGVVITLAVFGLSVSYRFMVVELPACIAPSVVRVRVLDYLLEIGVDLVHFWVDSRPPFSLISLPCCQELKRKYIRTLFMLWLVLLQFLQPTMIPYIIAPSTLNRLSPSSKYTPTTTEHWRIPIASELGV